MALVVIPLAVAGGVVVGGTVIGTIVGVVMREIHKHRMRVGAPLVDVAPNEPVGQQSSPQDVLRRVAANGVPMVCAREAAFEPPKLRHVQVS